MKRIPEPRLQVQAVDREDADVPGRELGAGRCGRVGAEEGGWQLGCLGRGEKERTESQTRNGAALGTLGPWEYMGYMGNFSVQGKLSE